MHILDVLLLITTLLLTIEGVWLLITTIGRPWVPLLLARPRVKVCIIFPTYRDYVELDRWKKILHDLDMTFVIVEDISNVNEKWRSSTLYLRRDTREGFKAGALNYAFDYLSKNGYKFDWALIFDADHVPQSREEIVSFLNYLAVTDANVVQAFWLDGLPLKSWLDWLIYGGRASSNLNLYHRKFRNLTGNALAIRWRLVEEGLRFPYSITEDYALTLLLLEHGIRVEVVPYVLSIGRSPLSFKAFLKQQLRWAEGTIRDTLKMCRRVWKCLTLREKVELFLHLNLYLQGLWLFLTLILLPFASLSTLLLLLAFTIVQFICYFISVCRYKPKYTLIYVALIYIMMVVHIYALLRALFVKKQEFTRTEKKDR